MDHSLFKEKKHIKANQIILKSYKFQQENANNKIHHYIQSNPRSSKRGYSHFSDITSDYFLSNLHNLFIYQTSKRKAFKFK